LPLYEYRCTSCGYSFEKIQKFSDAPEQVCPKCAGVLVRPVTAPALRFEGAGWYVNDYAGKGGAKAEAAGGGEGSGAKDSKDSKDAKAAPADGGSTAAAGPAPASTPATSSAPSTSSTPSGASSAS
jgi:putative FmdB family regulatory protein